MSLFAIITGIIIVGGVITYFIIRSKSKKPIDSKTATSLQIVVGKITNQKS